MLRLVLLAALALAAPAHAQSDPVALLDGREVVRLDGQWNYFVEPFGQALRSRNSRRDFPADRAAEAEAAGELVEYEWDHASTLTVPGDFTSQVPELWLYAGPVWYRHRFATPDHDGRAFLHFGGANYTTHVFVNGEKVALHEGGFLPFDAEVTGLLRADGRPNSLVVAVDNRRPDDGIPGRRTDWWNYGGLTRPVSLVLAPDTYVHDLTVRFDGDAISALVVVEGPQSDGAAVTVSIPELGLSADTRADASGRASVRFETAGSDLERWSTENPRRYTVVAEITGDVVSDRVGFRTVEVRGRELLVNGEPTFLRGIAMHEEAFDARGRRAVSTGDYRELLESARGLNANFVRLAHYPYGEDMLHLADSLGLLVWSEVPIYWEEIHYDDPQTLGLARAMMADLLDRDANRASVVIWSVANETPITEERMLFLTTLVDDVRRLDPTRLVSAALKSSSIEAQAADGAGGTLGGGGAGDTGSRSNSLTQRVDDPLGEYLDVLAVNTYVGWYGSRSPGEISEVTWETPFDKPIVFTEFGAGAVYGLRGAPTERWTEDYQADVIDHTMAVAVGTPGVVGTSPWVLKDFRSPRRWHSVHQQFWNRKGLVSETGERKLAFDVLRRWYDALARGERPTQALGLAP